MADLMVGHPETGRQFWVDVKGKAGRGGGWFMSPKSELPGLFYIFVTVGGNRSLDEFYILSQQRANELLFDYRAAHPDWNLKGEGFNRQMVEPFAGHWADLPDYDLLQSN
jgi:hypothetical protein